jgi:DNA polymerase-2
MLTRILDRLFPQRAEAQAAGDRIASQAIKILMNSFYGVLGASGSRFHNPLLAAAITSLGREVLLWSKGRFEDAGLAVLYGDTDSLFVLSQRERPADAQRLGEGLAAQLNAELARYVFERWQVSSRLELAFERLYLRLLLPLVRHGGSGARKRYAGLIDEHGDRRVVFTGLEAVRRDWSDLARRAQRELYERLFHDRPLDDYLERLVADLRGGRLDDLLVYRKALRKELDDYTESTPPHVAAARKLERPGDGLISYLITAAGPEPASERQHPIDYEHYVQKQLRPIAEPVLTLLGKDFSRVIGDDTQLDLFPAS